MHNRFLKLKIFLAMQTLRWQFSILLFHAGSLSFMYIGFRLFTVAIVTFIQQSFVIYNRRFVRPNFQTNLAIVVEHCSVGNMLIRIFIFLSFLFGVKSSDLTDSELASAGPDVVFAVN